MGSINILVPDLPESIVDATVVIWHKKPGEVVIRDEVLVEIETDKIVLEIPASSDGILDTILKDEGTTVTSRQILGNLYVCSSEEQRDKARFKENVSIRNKFQNIFLKELRSNTLSPAIRRLVIKYNLDPSCIKGTGVNGRLTREDINEYLKKFPSDEKFKVSRKETTTKALIMQQEAQWDPSARSEKRVPMTSLRKRIAERLLESKNFTVTLSTINEMNMQPIIDLRKKYGESFEKRHGIRLSFMSFYVKAAVEALKRYPEVNASIDGDDIVYRNYFDISMAISTPRGLVTPVLRDAETLGMADIEKKIKELVMKGRDGKLTINDLTGGNFTITNGGVFGSLMSTPIINPPQSAILGMHAIKDRPMAVDGKVEILPMMYLVLSYDHRLIDGRESIGFLVAIKELLEDPVRLLLDV